eukprot:RCo011062
MAYPTPTRTPTRDYSTPKSPGRDYYTPAGGPEYSTPGPGGSWDTRFTSSTPRSGEGSGGLSNVDFKKLMMTPRRVDETPIPDYMARKRKKKEGRRIDMEEVFAKPKKSTKDEDPRPPYLKRRRHDREYRDR